MTCLQRMDGTLHTACGVQVFRAESADTNPARVTCPRCRDTVEYRRAVMRASGIRADVPDPGGPVLPDLWE